MDKMMPHITSYDILQIYRYALCNYLLKIVFFNLLFNDAMLN